MNRMNRLRAAIVGAGLATSGAAALGADFKVEDQFTATFVTRIVDTPTGPMAVCGNPVPEDAEWIDAMKAASGIADFGTAVLLSDGSAVGASGPGAAHAGHAPAPGGAGIMILGGALMARRRR